MGLTGLWYLAQALMWHHKIEVAPETPPLAASAVPRADAAGASPAQIPFSRALASAEAALPGVRLVWALAPEHNRDYFTFAGSGGELFFDDYAHSAKINPWTGGVAEVSTPASMPPLQPPVIYRRSLALRHYRRYLDQGGLVPVRPVAEWHVDSRLSHLEQADVQGGAGPSGSRHSASIHRGARQGATGQGSRRSHGAAGGGPLDGLEGRPGVKGR